MCQSSAWFTKDNGSCHSIICMQSFRNPTATDPPVGSAATSGFNVIPGEASKCSPTTIEFLTQPWAVTLSQSHHFQFTFLPGHCIGSLVDHQCMTVCPLNFSLIKEAITIMFSDKNAHKHIDTALCHHLMHFTLKKSQVYVAVLLGPRRSVQN